MGRAPSHYSILSVRDRFGVMQCENEVDWSLTLHFRARHGWQATRVVSFRFDDLLVGLDPGLSLDGGFSPVGAR